MINQFLKYPSTPLQALNFALIEYRCAREGAILRRKVLMQLANIPTPIYGRTHDQKPIVNSDNDVDGGNENFGQEGF